MCCAGANWGYVLDVTGDSETFRLDNLESDVFGAACGAPDRDGIS